VFRGSPQLAQSKSTGSRRSNLRNYVHPERLVIQDFNLQFKKVHSQSLMIFAQKLRHLKLSHKEHRVTNEPDWYGNARLIFAVYGLDDSCFCLI
jgi:hypothetical protein